MRPEQPSLGMYVDRTRPGYWIVRDREGDFWMVPSGDQAWERRHPYTPGDDTQLEPIPGHYKYLLGIGC